MERQISVARNAVERAGVLPGNIAVFHHAAGPEPPVTVHPAIIHADAAIIGLDPVQPFNPAIGWPHQRKASGKGAEQAAILIRQAERTDTMRHIECHRLPFIPIPAIKDAGVNIRPPQRLLAVVPHRAFAQCVLDIYGSANPGHALTTTLCRRR